MKDTNSGDWNTGNRNSGDWNSGDWNTGNWNSGDWNSGDWNTGNRNTGNWNSGDWNTGNWNSGDWNTGYFNTKSPDRIMIFDRWVEMTPEEFLEKHNIIAGIPLNQWVDKSKMTDDEKKNVGGWEKAGGYLKILDFKEACQIWWDEHPERHEDFMGLPNFNAEIFEEITGIRVDKERETIKIGDIEYDKKEVEERLKDIKPVK